MKEVTADGQRLLVVPELKKGSCEGCSCYMHPALCRQARDAADLMCGISGLIFIRPEQFHAYVVLRLTK